MVTIHLPLQNYTQYSEQEPFSQALCLYGHWFMVLLTSTSLTFWSLTLPVNKTADGGIYDQEKWERHVFYLLRLLRVPKSLNRSVYTRIGQIQDIADSLCGHI